MGKFERDDLKTHLRVWVQLVSEKQQQAITAHNPADMSYWSHELAKLISLGQQLDSGELMLLSRGDHVIQNDFAEMRKKIDYKVSDGVTSFNSPLPKAFTDSIRDGIGMLNVSVETLNHENSKTIVCRTISKSDYEKNFIGEWKPDDQGFDRRKLRDAIVKAVNLSEPAATRIVTLNRGHSVKELVYMALECRGKQLCSARDQEQDSQWYANHHVAAVLHHVEELMMQ